MQFRCDKPCFGCGIVWGVCKLGGVLDPRFEEQARSIHITPRNKHPTNPNPTLTGITSMHAAKSP
jgi:hypothetical protein